MKPDWATRLQRTFARKYDAGFAKGLMFGKAVGAKEARDLAIPYAYNLGVEDEQERIIGILKENLADTPQLADLIELIESDDE
jgi:hypothetical protein